MTNQVMPAMAPRPIVSIVDQSVRALSTDVSNFFGKNHRDVLRDVRNLIESEPSLNERNFALVNYRDAKGELRPAYSMDRTGFSLLAMGFTGEKALKFKLAYIRQFEAMEAQLKGISYTLTPEQQRQIQVAVAGKALGSSVAFRSIYRILKDHFKVGSYKQIPSIRFSEAIEVIQNVRLRLTNVDDKTDSVDVCTITFTELNNLASLARLFLIAKPEMLRIYKVLRELDSPLAPRVYSLATEPVFAFGLLERLFSRHGIDIRDCQKQLAR